MKKCYCSKTINRIRFTGNKRKKKLRIDTGRLGYKRMDFPFPILFRFVNIALLKMQVYGCMCNGRCFRYDTDLHDRVLQRSSDDYQCFLISGK